MLDRKITVLIVDDESLERVLIKKGFKWDEEGFEIVGEASNGEEALRYFDLKNPDIIFADINMPYMDGLTFAQKVKERSKECKIVIVTGYREFEYARKAVKIGVEDFLLKPINLEEIKDIAIKLKSQIEKEQGIDEEFQSLKKTASESQGIVIASFLQRLVEKRVEKEEAIQKINLFNLPHIYENSICMGIWFHKQNEHGVQVYSNEILEIIKRNCRGDICFIHYLDNIIIYYLDVETKRLLEDAKHLSEILKNEYKVRTQIGIGSAHTGVDGICKSYKEAEKAISVSAILDGTAWHTYEEYEKIKNISSKKPEINWNDFIFIMESGVWDKVEDYIDGYVKAIEDTFVTDSQYIKLMGMDMISKSSIMLSKYGKSAVEIVGEEVFLGEILKIESVLELKFFLKNVLKEILKFTQGLCVKKGNSLVEKAQTFLDENLSNSQLGLKLAASELFVNESYLSRIFKQEIGESLIEYITRKRIEKSILLLNTTDLKAYEIAEQVGINDPHYFSICFKKQVGVTIKEYKNRKS